MFKKNPPKMTRISFYIFAKNYGEIACEVFLFLYSFAKHLLNNDHVLKMALTSLPC